MRNITKAALAGVALIMLAAAPARSQVVLTPGGGWSVFEFAGLGSSWQDEFGDTLDYQFTIGSKETLLIADGYNAGDQFNICINSFCALDTTTPIYDPYTFNPAYFIGDNWYDAFQTPYSAAFSHAALLLQPGTYDITGTLIAEGEGYENYGGYGAGAIALVPEPASWAMMLLGVAAIGFGLRGRRSRALPAAA
jgi:hypothetical protein